MIHSRLSVSKEKIVFMKQTLLSQSGNNKMKDWSTCLLSEKYRVAEVFRNVRFSFLHKSRLQLRADKFIYTKQSEMIVWWETEIFVPQNVSLCERIILFIRHRLHNYWPLSSNVHEKTFLSALSWHFFRSCFRLKNALMENPTPKKIDTLTREGMYVKCNTEASSDLCILKPSQMVIKVHQLRSHFN
jgi:hypothetical protein